MFKVKVKILALFIFFISISCKEKRSNVSEIIVPAFSSKKPELLEELKKKKDTAYIKDDLLYVRYNNDSKFYPNLIKNYSSLYSSVRCLDNSFFLGYEYSSSSTKMICTYKFMYDDPLKIIFKEIVKFNEKGTASNIVFFDDKLYDLNYDSLEGLYEDLNYNFIKSSNQIIKLYFKEENIGNIFTEDSSKEYFIDSPKLYDFKLIDCNKIQKINLLNDVAYFMERKGDYRNAILILEKIIEKYPNRIVAYINLGDAYWGNENQEKAKEAYRIYISKMKNKGLEHKIPQRVYDRVKQSKV